MKPHVLPVPAKNNILIVERELPSTSTRGPLTSFTQPAGVSSPDNVEFHPHLLIRKSICKQRAYKQAKLIFVFCQLLIGYN